MKIRLAGIIGMTCWVAIAAAAPAAGIPYPDALADANVTVTSLADGNADGLILGNGDLYGLAWERGGELIMRVTKNDIWDARVDTSKDGPLPKVDVVTGEVTGSTGTGPCYRLRYPQPRCAAAVRLGAVAPSGVLPWNCVRPAPRHGLSPEEDGNGAVMEVAGSDGSSTGYQVTLPGKPAVSLVTSFDSGEGDVLERAIALARTTINEQEQALIAAHEQAWERFWSRSGVALADKDLQRWWYRLLYFAGTVCNPDAPAPVALMPPLATDNTPWHGDIHHNYNAWQAFWPLPGANQAALTDPWISYLNQMLPRFKNLARVTYDIDGACVPIASFMHEPAPADCKSRNKRQVSKNPWGLTIGMLGMTLQSMWERHLFQPDREYLEAWIYPMLKEGATFYVTFMNRCKRDDESGKVRLGPSYSPEHGKMGIYNCPFDIAYVHYTFDAFVRAADELGRDADLAADCRRLKALLPDYPTADNPDGHPVVVDWEGCAYRQIRQHNIEVPASPVFPGNQVTWFSPEPQKELFRRTILDTRQTGNNSHVMFNIAKARLSMPRAVADAKAFFVPRTLPNGLIRMPWAHGAYMQETIGLVGLVNEFLLQSVGPAIRLFPCWPDDGTAEFAGLRAHGGFVVSARHEAGKVVRAEITSAVGGKLRLLSPWPALTVNGKPLQPDARGIVTVDTHPGERLIFANRK